MENPTKALILLVGILIWSCNAKDEVPRSPPEPSLHSAKSNTLASAVRKEAEPLKYPIGKGLFRDSLGTIYLKTKNRRVRNPNNESKNWPDSIFHSKVSLREEKADRSLSEVLDTASFSRIDDMGVYFQDSALIYVYSIWPYSDQFFAMKKAGARFFGAEKEYLLVGGKLYSHGQTVEGINVNKVWVVRFRKTDRKGYHEFITDGKVLIHGYYAMDENRLSFFDDMSEQDREIIRKLYFKPDPKRQRKMAP